MPPALPFKLNLLSLLTFLLKKVLIRFKGRLCTTNLMFVPLLYLQEYLQPGKRKLLSALLLWLECHSYTNPSINKIY